MEVVKGTIEEQSHKVTLSKEKFDIVNTGIGSFTEIVNAISASTESLDEERKRVVDIVQNLSAIAQENAASSEETSASAQELTATMLEVSEAVSVLKELSDNLNEEVRIFQI
ncbi:MAG TPA: methyl-accepting chemotaxis protein, partial [Lachnospiraceae bacterium]|nr:methyl-accepting chemotaxis protein [Lachnospiraceae bacterium]